MTLEAILQKLQNYSPGGVLALPANAFGTGALSEVITEYCEGQVLRANNVNLQQGATAVQLTAIGANRPFGGMALQASFVPDPSDSNGALMTLVATPSSSWTLAASWQLLANSFAEKLKFLPITMTLGTGIGGGALKGLSFDGTLRFTGESHWTSLQWLIAQLASVELIGAVKMRGEVPVFSLTAPIHTPVLVPGLGQLNPAFQFSCEALSRPHTPGMSTQASTGPIFPSYSPLLDMALEAQIPLGSGVPVAIDLTAPDGLVAVSADVTGLTHEALKAIERFLSLDNIGGFLPKTAGFEPSTSLSLVDLGFTIDPVRKTLTSTRIELATTVDWPLARGIEITEIGFELVVPFKAPVGTPSVFATVFGSIVLPGGELDISGSHGNGFQLAAGLSENSHIKLTDLLDRVLKTQLEAELYLEELEMLASTNGTWLLIAGLSGNWSFSVGIAEVALLGAWIQLGEEGSGVSGQISATARLGSATDGLIFSGAWVLPNTFLFAGLFPNIELTELATKLTGTKPPAGMPEVSLTNATASIAWQSGSGNTAYYDFSMAASATLAGHGELGRAGFDVRKEGDNFGFLIGFELPTSWSPGDIWQPLASLFGWLTFERSGLVISTLSNTAPTLSNLSMPSLPATVGPGVTFFTSLELVGKGFGFLAELFSQETKLNLLALIDSSTPVNSTITASLGASAGKNAVQFTGLTLTLQPAATRFELSAGALFTLKQGTAVDQVKLTGKGAVQLEPEPDFELQVTLTNWVEPFGIKLLTVDDFGLDLGVEGGVLNIGALGVITINQGADSFRIAIGAEFADFEVPDAIVFELQSVSDKTLMLSSVIAQLTSLDLTKVPVLGGIGFADLKLWLIGNPDGWKIGGHTFPPGIAVHADVTLYSWELTLDIEIHATTGIKAHGAVNQAINLFDVLVISSFDGKSGPSAEIDTSKLASSTYNTNVQVGASLPNEQTPPYLWLDGQVKFLQFEDCKIHASVSKTSFEFELEFVLLNTVGAKLECALIDDQNFTALADLSVDLDLTLGPFLWEGIELIPKVHIVGPKGAVSIGIAVNKMVAFDLAFGLAFEWDNVHVNVAPHFTATELKNDLTQLWPTALAWMQANLATVFAEVLHNAEKWIKAMESDKWQANINADQVTHVLQGYFKISVAEAADYLSQFDFEFKEMVNALVYWFKVTAAEAARLLGQVPKKCAINSANKELIPEPPETVSLARAPSKTLLGLADSPAGQRMLVHYHAHRSELMALCEHTDVERRLANIVVPDDQQADERAVVDVGVEILRILREGASPGLRGAIEDSLLELERRSGMTHDEFLADLKR